MKDHPALTPSTRSPELGVDASLHKGTPYYTIVETIASMVDKRHDMVKIRELYWKAKLELDKFLPALTQQPPTVKPFPLHELQAWLNREIKTSDEAPEGDGVKIMGIAYHSVLVKIERLQSESVTPPLLLEEFEKWVTKEEARHRRLNDYDGSNQMSYILSIVEDFKNTRQS